ncbi:hypothetical protein [Paenibacillus sp. URB8-2]|uniref:hypothetical protein n=1 Tax=Paenibacillus sp. URB8-2 TaxID=2741301 RepID=UPI0015BE7BD9|nr:hypothetical protein [Paenibacillus sp. URB8-2]BCG60067.1 hypothetical protein PUR_34920 [Paenibacillus sp. URB8-2]
MYKDLDELFKKSGFPCQYTLAEAHQLLKQHYKVLELDKDSFKSLSLDPSVSYNDMVCFYEITDTEVLSSIYNDNEKQMHREFSLMHSSNPVIYDNEEELVSQLLWRDIQEGKKLRIVLESVDKKHISGFTLQGVCENLLQDLIILKGIPEKDCKLGNPQYEYYLESLRNTGRI